MLCSVVPHLFVMDLTSFLSALTCLKTENRVDVFRHDGMFLRCIGDSENFAVGRGTWRMD